MRLRRLDRVHLAGDGPRQKIIRTAKNDRRGDYACVPVQSASSSIGQLTQSTNEWTGPLTERTGPPRSRLQTGFP
jgi:hypothetical protein